MNKFIDLHMHTTCSEDGSFTPTEIVKQCHEAGITIMAIADHNSVKAIDEAQKEAQKYQISYIPATEIDCTFQGINLHVVGYGIDHHADIFTQLEENIMNQERANSLQKLKLTNQLGFDLSQEQLDPISYFGVYTGEMFAEVLLNDERYQNHELLKPYRKGGPRGDNPYVNFYWDYYSQGKPCYTEVVYPSLEDIIEIVRQHGGVTVLAHPGNNLKGRFEVFDEMVKVGINGVEAFSNYHDEATNQYFYDKGKQYNLLMTCGSDYHGKTKPAIHLGETGCFIDEHEIEEQLKVYHLI